MNKSKTVPILDEAQKEVGIAIVEQDESGEGIESVEYVKQVNGNLSVQYAVDESNLERLNASLKLHPLAVRFFTPIRHASNSATP